MAVALIFFTGILKQPENWAARHQATGAPLEHLHCSVDLVMCAAATQLRDIKSFIYCETSGKVPQDCFKMATDLWYGEYQTI